MCVLISAEMCFRDFGKCERAVRKEVRKSETLNCCVFKNFVSHFPHATTITEEELQKEEELEDYYDYTWKEQLMAPVRNVGQMLSGGVKGAAESINTGLSAANEWWDGGSGDADYSALKMFRNSFFN